MPTLDASVFKRKMRAKMLLVNLRLKKYLELKGEQIYSDIENGVIEPLSPSWKAAKHADGTSYFNTKSQGGLFEAIRDSRYVAVSAMKSGRIGLAIGSQTLLDATTISQHGYPYWRLFEYGQMGERMGGSETHGYVPFEGGGYMDKVSPLGRASRPHPGVLPVFLFSDTYRVERVRMRKEIKNMIVNILKNES